MYTQPTAPAGYLTFTLHAHLPYVVNHGTWPHGIEWLHEAAAETYLPLLRMLGRLQRDGIALRCNLNLSPILLEQLAHPVFQAEFPHYLERKITAAREDEAFFLSTGEHHYAQTAAFWHAFFSENLSQFESLGRDIVASFRFFQDAGLIDIITCCATHGYLPLLGTDESVRAQVRTALDTHQRHLGRPPRGIWAPECGYRPAGHWHFPVAAAGHTPLKSFHRIGVEQALAESGLEFFFADTHLVEQSAAASSPYSALSAMPAEPPSDAAASSRLYQPYIVAGPGEEYPGSEPTGVAVFPRDPRTGLQVWSGDYGYPGDAAYLDFHKKRWPGGHRYWRVTGPHVDMADKAAYDSGDAAQRLRSHAAHFVGLVRDALAPSSAAPEPPILCAPFDAELFGHWWFEGVQWLEEVARILHAEPAGGIQLTSCAAYLEQHAPTASIHMREGSWGAGGTNHVWLNADTSWTYQQLYPAELFVRELCSSPDWKDGATGERIARQICRELLLLESSDWQFLITTGAARDYAESRFRTHLENFQQLKDAWTEFLGNRRLSPDTEDRLRDIEARDNIFADIHPEFWAAGAHDNRNPVRAPRSRPLHTVVDNTAGLASTPAGDPPRMELPKFNAWA